MYVGDNVKRLRTERGLTQKALADKLGVTYQAVSQWERSDVEPSLDVIRKMSEIFGVSVEDIILEQGAQKKEEVTSENLDSTISNNKNESNNLEEQKLDTRPVIGACDQCHKAIREGDKFKTVTTRSGKYMYCEACQKARAESEKANLINNGIKCRHKGYIWGAITFAVVLAILVAGLILNLEEPTFDMTSGILVTIFVPILSFFFVFSANVKNNFIFDTWLAICSWGCVKFPGIIFSFDWGGFVFLIGMKILFAILGFLLGLCAAIAATVVCLLLSAFVFPYAITVSYKHPEKTSII